MDLRRVNHWVVLGTLVVIMMVISIVTHHVAATTAQIRMVTGSVTAPNGTPVPGVAATETDPDDTTVRHGSAVTRDIGSFTLDVQEGTYDFHFVPPSSSTHNRIVQSTLLAGSNQAINASW